MTGGGSARLGDRECRRSRESAHEDANVGGAEKQGFQESRHGSSPVWYENWCITKNDNEKSPVGGFLVGGVSNNK